MNSKDLILVGGGAHCRSCIDVIESQGEFKIIGIVDSTERLGQKVLGYEIIACDQDLPSLAAKHQYFLITIGGTTDYSRRVAIFEQLKELGASFPVIISPLAYVSKTASIEEGTIVMHRSLVNTEAKIGKNCIINTMALVEHNTKVGDHCHISAGGVINGSCTIGNKVFVGSNSVIADKLEIASDVVIGAGSFVAKSIQQPGIYIAPGKLVGICKV